MNRTRTALTHLLCAVATTMIFDASAHAQSEIPPHECKRITDPVTQSQDERMKTEFEIRYWVSNSRLSASGVENIDGTDVRVNAGLDLETRNLPGGNTANLAVQLPGGSTIFGRDFDTSADTKLDIKQARIGYSPQAYCDRFCDIRHSGRRIGPRSRCRHYSKGLCA